MRYKVFQLDADHPSFRDRAFRDLDAIGGVVDLDAYRLVYTSEVASENDMTALETVFRRFNIEHPDDYRGRSLSVSDIVLLASCRPYYCQTAGWARLLPEQQIGSVQGS
jgi:hypothetical protein